MAIKFPFKKSLSDFSVLHEETDLDYDFSEAINLFKSQRKKFDISLEELSKKTKISKNVLIAIENGWKNYLPERTYLTSMIKKLEIELHLEEESLNGLLEQKIITKSISNIKLNFINIDFLNSWFGSFLYFIFILLSILALNSQQKYLLKINSISTEPILIEDTVMEDKSRINSQQ